MIKPASTCLIAYQRVEWQKYMWRHLDLMEVMKERFREGVKEGLSKIRLEGTLRRDCPFTPPPSENDKDGEGGTKSEDEEYMEEEEFTSDEEEEFDDTSDEDEEANQFKMNARRQGENPAGNATDYGFSDLQLQEILEEAQTLQDDDEPPVIDSSEE